MAYEVGALEHSKLEAQHRLLLVCRICGSNVRFLQVGFHIFGNRSNWIPQLGV
jgi:hypothetical protein